MRKHPFHKTGAILIGLLVVLASCEEYTEPVNFAPTVSTGGYENPYRFGATLRGSIDNSVGSTLQECGIQYSAFPSFAEPVNRAVEGEGAWRDFSVDVAGLTPGTNYYYRTYAFSGYNTVYGEPLSFSTTSTNAPVFGPTHVTNVSLTGFEVQTELLDDGGSALMMQGFIIKQVESEEDTELAVNTPGASLLVCGDDFHTAVKDLYTGTLYAIRPYGVANGIGYGRIAYVRTQSTDRTVLSSCTLSDTTFNSVRAEAHVLSAGTHPVTEVGFCYSTENSQPTVANLTILSALAGNSFSASLEGLDSGTRYYIRAYAKDEAGEYVYGETTEFVTGINADEEIIPAWEYDMLKQLYEETNGDNWFNNDNWLTDKPLSSWYGLTLDEHGYVQSINLSNNNLTGTLNVESFKSLKEININDNSLESICLRFPSQELGHLELSNCITNYGSVSVSDVPSVTIKDNKQIGSLIVDCQSLLVDNCDFGEVYTPFSTVNAEYVTISNSTMFNCGLNNDYLVFKNSKTTDTWHCVTNVRAELIDSYCSVICSWDFSLEAEIIVTNTTLIQPEWNETKTGTYTFVTDSEGWARMFGAGEEQPERSPEEGDSEYPEVM